MLTYRAEGAEEQVERGVVDKDTPTRTVYRTPVPEFDIARMSVPAGCVAMPPSTPSVVLCARHTYNSHAPSPSSLLNICSIKCSDVVFVGNAKRISMLWGILPTDS